MMAPIRPLLVLAAVVTMVVARTPVGYMGCYNEGSGGRALVGPKTQSSQMTIESCQSFCSGFRYYGLEYGSECYCGYSVFNDAYQVPDSACNVPCAGNSQETCGGGNLVSVYKANFTSQAPPREYKNIGCYSEPSQSRALQRVLDSSLMTTNKCLVICGYGKFSFAALEFGRECWCGNTLNPASKPVDKSSCSLPCGGNASDTCGGKLALDVYAGMAPKSPSKRAQLSADEARAEKEDLADFLVAEIL